jgi:hypothetical protein
MPDRYPGYDVLSKRDTPSWNEQTRRVIDARLSVPDQPAFLDAREWLTLKAVCERIVPQPPLRDAWRQGLRALEGEALDAHGRAFYALDAAERDALLVRIQKGEASSDAWGGMPPALFFKERLLHDIVQACFSHPTLWSRIGWGGPASPRGYVRMGFNKRDPWEAVEVHDGDVIDAERRNRRVR